MPESFAWGLSSWALRVSVPIRNGATNRNYMQHFIKISRLEKDTSFVFSSAFSFFNLLW